MKKPNLSRFAQFLPAVSAFSVLLVAGCSGGSSTSSTAPSILKMELYGARGSSLTAVTDGTECPSGEKVVWTNSDQSYPGHSIDDPDPTKAISASVLCGSSIYTQTLAPKAVSSGPSVFSIINPDKTVTLWGSKRLGGDMSSLQTKPRNVTAVYINQRATAILQSDGKLFALGRTASGGGINGPDEYTTPNVPLNNVKEVWPLNRGFLAQNIDGSIAGWGNLDTDGDIAPISKMLKELSTPIRGVRAIAANSKAVAVIQPDSTVATFGDPDLGGDSQSFASKLLGAIKLIATNFNFTALKGDGSIVMWGQNQEVGEAFTGNELFPQRVVAITKNGDVLSTLDANGGVAVFGDPTVDRGADRSVIGANLQSQVKQVYANKVAFAALKKDGSVITWGDQHRNSAYLTPDQLKGIKSIFQTSMAFAALRNDGGVTVWGDETRGGDSSEVDDQLTDVVTIAANDYAFAAIKKDGSVVSWGSASHGGDSSAVANQLKNIRAIYSTSLGGFLAVSKEGQVISWGSKSAGGVLPANNLYVPFLQN